jgi:ABC-2 type transport system permease protein
MNRLRHIFWLGIKEMRSLGSDTVIVLLLIYSFSYGTYTEATGISVEVSNSSIAIVDEDRSVLSRRIIQSFQPPRFFEPVLIGAHQVDEVMDQNRFLFVVDIPPRFEADVLEGRRPEVQVNIDATATMQAGIGAGYIHELVTAEVARFVSRTDEPARMPVELVTRLAFNPNGSQWWFAGIVSIINHVGMMTIVLTGAALIREREHGTIEHLLVMPLSPLDLVLAKVWSSALVILVAAALCLVIVIEMVLEVPVAGSRLLFLGGSALYLFFAAALGIFLGTVSRSMAQFALLFILTMLILQMLSGTDTPIESQPEWLRRFTFFLPSRHYVSFSQAIICRGADFSMVWREFVIVLVLGLVFFALSLRLFRKSVTAYH